jgi:HSP20 family protein
MAEKAKRRPGDRDRTAPATGFIKGLTELVEKLGELAETGRELRRGGEFNGPDDKLKAVYGLRVKLGVGGEAVDVEPFGDLKFDRKSRHPVVEEVREPLVDVIEEASRVLIVAEMPGITAQDVSLTIDDDLMSIEAARKGRKYRKEVLLPRPVAKKNVSVSCNNGIVQIECRLD